MKKNLPLGTRCPSLGRARPKHADRWPHKTDLTPASRVIQPRETALGFAGTGALLWEVSTLHELTEMILKQFGVT